MYKNKPQKSTTKSPLQKKSILGRTTTKSYITSIVTSSRSIHTAPYKHTANSPPNPLSLPKTPFSTSKKSTKRAQPGDDYDPYDASSYLFKSFPTTSTKFARKERDPVTGKMLKAPAEEHSEPTTWDFRSLFETSFIEIQTKTKTQARTSTSKDDDGNVIDDVDRLATYSEGQLKQIALGLGEYKPKVPINTQIQAKNLSKLLTTQLQKAQTGFNVEDDENNNKSYNFNQTQSTTLDISDESNPFNSLRRMGTKGNVYSGFLDPIQLPTFITTPPIVNLRAARVLATKLHNQVQGTVAQNMHDSVVKGENPDANGNDNGNDIVGATAKMKKIQEEQTQNALREQALLWFARSSAAGDFDSSLQLAQLFEQELSLRLGLNDLDPVEQTEIDNVLDEIVESQSKTKRPKVAHKIEPIFELTPKIQSEVEIAYKALTDALIPRLHGKQIQGVDYRSHHPIISTLFYYETFVQQSEDPDALTAYCDWLFGLDELFVQLVPSDEDGNDQFGLEQNSYFGKVNKYNNYFQTLSQQNILEDDSINQANRPIYFKSQHFSNNEPSALPPMDESTGEPQEQQVVPEQQEQQEQQDDYFPTSKSFIGSYIQAYLKPLSLHPVYAESAELLLDSFAQHDPKL